MLALAIHLNLQSELIHQIQIFCDLPFADPILKTYIAAEVMGLGFLL